MATRPHSEAPGLCPPLSPPHERVLSHFRRVQLFSTLWTVAHQAPLSKGFSRQERWSGLPFSSPMHERQSQRMLKLLPNCKMSAIVIYTVKGFGIVNKAERDVFLELFCFSDDISFS